MGTCSIDDFLTCNFHKIIVIGCPGSGKSYVSQQLHEITNIPLYHLDVLNWNPNWIPTPRAEFIIKQEEIMKTEKWIIDGNYENTLELRLCRTEVVIFLDMPTEICLQAEEKRRGTKRSDLPDYLEEEYDPDFIQYIKDFKKNNEKIIWKLIDKYFDIPVLILKSREEVNAFLVALKINY